ncbi:MAG TPA: hypothetical protein VGN23_10480 [Verrucomicrobiae bacterium]|jgi:hypothetical protein
MKALLVSLCSLLSLVAVGSIALSVHYSHQVAQTRQLWRAQSITDQSNLDNYADITKSNQRVIASLQRKAAQLDGLIAATNDLGAQLQAANDRIQSLEAADRQRDADASLIPPPTIKGDAFFFPQVLSVQNLVLATNATFAYITGRRLVFHREDQTAVVVDVDKIHPLILQYLKIDADDAKAKQAQMDAAYAAQQRAGAIATVQDEAQRERLAAIAVQQEQADAAAQAAQAAQAQSAADKEKADAAMLNASKPPTIVVSQQSQQQAVFVK